MSAVNMSSACWSLLCQACDHDLVVILINRRSNYSVILWWHLFWVSRRMIMENVDFEKQNKIPRPMPAQIFCGGRAIT